MKDKKEIEKLYLMYANEILKDDENAFAISQKLNSKQDELLKTLTKEQEDLFNEILELQAERGGEVNKDIFIFAFSLATKLFTEGLK